MDVAGRGVGDQQVGIPIIVVIPDGGSHPVPSALQSVAFGSVFESHISSIEVQAVPMARRRLVRFNTLRMREI